MSLSPLALPASILYARTSPDAGVHVSETLFRTTCAVRLAGADGTAPSVARNTTVDAATATRRVTARAGAAAFTFPLARMFFETVIIIQIILAVLASTAAGQESPASDDGTAGRGRSGALCAWGRMARNPRAKV